MTPRSLATLLAMTLCAPSAVRAEPGPEDELLGLCPLGGAEHARSSRALERLGRMAGSVDPAEGAAAVNAALAELLGQPCYRVAAERAEGAPVFDGVPSFLAWWQAGGEAWLRSFVGAGPTPGRARARDERRVVFPPEVRRALTLETAGPDHPLRPLLCSAADPGCGGETLGWVSRAETAFAEHARAEAERAREHDPDGPGGPDLESLCAAEARGAAPDQRFVVWYDCVVSRLPTVDALPPGRLRAPDRGWLVVRGRRGHYRFCDEARAYDLATGAAFVASSCSGLALREGGSVDFARTDAGRAERALTGRLPLDRLREAAWMVLLAESVQRGLRPAAATVALPPGVEVRYGAPRSFRGMGIHGWISSAQTHLSWAWHLDGRVQAEGTLVWPSSDRAGPSHAAALLREAETGLSAGCPVAALPADLFAPGRASAVSALDADPSTRPALEERLVRALRGLPGPGACVPAPARAGAPCRLR